MWLDGLVVSAEEVEVVEAEGEGYFRWKDVSEWQLSQPNGAGVLSLDLLFPWIVNDCQLCCSFFFQLSVILRLYTFMKKHDFLNKAAHVLFISCIPSHIWNETVKISFIIDTLH